MEACRLITHPRIPLAGISGTLGLCATLVVSVGILGCSRAKPHRPRKPITVVHPAAGHPGKPEDAALKAALAHLEGRMAALADGPLAPSVAPILPRIEKAIALEAQGAYADAESAWKRVHCSLAHDADASTQPVPADFSQRDTRLIPGLLELDAGRAFFEHFLTATQGHDRQTPDIQAERHLQAFHMAYFNRREAPVDAPMGAFASTRAQEDALATDIAACRKMLGRVQAIHAAKVAALPRCHVIEDIPFLSPVRSDIRVKMLSPTARTKEDPGVKYLAVYVGKHAAPRFVVELTDQPVKWDIQGYPPRERRLRLHEAMLSLHAPQAEEADANRDLVGLIHACFNPGKDDVAVYAIYDDAIGLVIESD